MASQSYLANYNNSNVQLKLVVYTVETSIAGNWTRERADLWMQVNNASGQYWNNYAQACGLNVNGNQINGSCTFDARSTGDKLLLGTQDFVVYHDGNGSKSFNVTAYHNSGTGLGNASLSGTYTCDVIPRYTNFTQHYINNTYLQGVQVCWACDSARDWTQYSLNDGAWTDAGDTVAGDNKSGHYTVNGLAPNTNYYIKTRIRRADSGLWTESGNVWFTTKDRNRITSSIFSGNTDTALRVTANSASATRCDIYLELLNANKSARIGSVIRHDNTLDTTFTVAEMLTLASYIPNDNSANFRINIITKVGEADLYNDYRDGTFSVINANPTFSNFVYADTNATTINLTGSNQKIVKGYSNVKATVSVANKATALKSATMNKYIFKNGSQQVDGTYSSSADVLMNLSNVLDSTMQVYAVDSRGNSTQKNIVATTFLDYAAINTIACTGTRGTGGIGSVVTLVYNGTIWNKTFGNIANSIVSCVYKYKKTTDTTYTTGTTVITPTLSVDTYSFSGAIAGDLGANGFDSSYSYDIQLIITDKLSTSTFNMIINSGTPQMAFGIRTGVGVGKFVEAGLPDGSLDVLATVKASELIINSKTLLDRTYPVGAYYISNVVTSPATLFGGTWVQVIDRMLIGAGSTYAVGATGGASTHTLSVTEMPWHGHSISADGIHAHGQYVTANPGSGPFNGRQDYDADANGLSVYAQGNNTMDAGSHSHGGGVGGSGGGAAHNNLPPYRAAYIWYRSV